MSDLLSVTDLSRDDILAILATAADVKSDPAAHADLCAGRSMVMLFEKPSLRTRVSFEVGFAGLGGTVVFLDHQDVRIGERESIADYGRNLERWCDVLVARTFAHDTIVQLADATSIPVINALSELEHPCQALADALTLQERLGDLAGVALAYVGDGGGNVCHSLLLLAARLGMTMTVVAPDTHRPLPGVLEQATELATGSGATLAVTSDLDAVAGHDAVYTDTWVSMGHESESADRNAALAPYQVNAALMSIAGPDALFLHCLPAHRGAEVTGEVIDGPTSVVFDQAENRMHAQNAVVLHLLGIVEEVAA